MKSVAFTAVDRIAVDVRTVDELQVDAVPVVPDLVARDVHMVAFPAVYGVSHDGVERDVAGDVVACNRAVPAVLEHHAELVGAEHAVAYRDVLHVFGMQAAVVYL